MTRYRPRRSRVLMVIGLLVLFNAPLVTVGLSEVRLDADGVRAEAEVLDTLQIDGGARSYVSFRMPRDLDPDQFTWVAELRPGAFAEAERDGTVTVTVVPGRPESYRVDGERSGNRGLLWTLVGDAMVLGLALFGYWWSRREFERERARRRSVALSTGRAPGDDPAPLRLVATDDLVPAPAHRGHAWGRDREGSVEICGDVVAVRDEEVELRVEHRRVVVTLDGHRNTAAFRERALVRARLDDSTG